MRTRTLLLLAVACGLVILLAGGVQLLRLTGDEHTADDVLAVGATAVAGDLSVTVVAAAESEGSMVVTLRLGGVDDPSGIDGFRLVVPGVVISSVEEPAAAGRCATVTVASQTCDIAFVTTEAQGSARVLLLRRGEDQRRWSLG